MLGIRPFIFSPPKFIFYHSDTMLMRNQVLIFLIFIIFLATFITIIIVHTCKPDYCKNAVRNIRYRLMNDVFSICLTPLLIFACQFSHQNPGGIFLAVLILGIGIFYVAWIAYKIISIKKMS